MAESNGYNKRPMWQWVLIYVVIGGIIYAGIYYFVIAKKGSSSPYSAGSTPNYQAPSSAPTTQQAPSSAPSQTAPKIPGY